MCGRFSLPVDIQAVANRFEAFLGKGDWKPHYNIAPTQLCLTVVAEAQGRIIQPMSWGLIPHWSKDKKMAFQMINARAETVKSKPSFRESYKHKRCLVPADGFFEWKKESQGKVPYRATLKTGELFALAGLWDAWRDEQGQEIKTFTILTTAANSLLAPLHDRMPVILKRADEAAWLDPRLSDPAQLDALIGSYPAEEMMLYPVNSVVNSWKNDTPECIQRA